MDKILSNKRNLIILLVLVGILVFIFNYFKPVNMAKYVVNNGFELDEDDILYVRKMPFPEDEYDYEEFNNYENRLLFDSYSYQLTNIIDADIDDYSLSYNGLYDFTEGKTSFILRMKYDTVNIIYDGTYNENTKKFKCNKNFVHGVNLDNVKKNYCDIALNYTKNFIIVKNDIFNTEAALRYMRRQKN